MSNYSDFQDAQKAYNTTTKETVENFSTAVANLNVSITRIQSINRNLSSSDQALMDDLQKQANALTAELNKTHIMLPPDIPTEATMDKEYAQHQAQHDQKAHDAQHRHDKAHEANKPFFSSSHQPGQPTEVQAANRQANDPHNYQGNPNFGTSDTPSSRQPEVQPTNQSNIAPRNELPDPQTVNNQPGTPKDPS